jgi:hypothetical protein
VSSESNAPGRNSVNGPVVTSGGKFAGRIHHNRNSARPQTRGVRRIASSSSAASASAAISLPRLPIPISPPVAGISSLVCARAIAAQASNNASANGCPMTTGAKRAKVYRLCRLFRIRKFYR